MLATLVDSTYPWRFVDAGETALAVLLLAMIILLALWSDRRGPDGLRLTLCIFVITALLPLANGCILLLLVWISEKSGYDVFDPEWRKTVTALMFTLAYAWALLVMTRTLLRRSWGAHESPRCFKCGGELGEGVSGRCPRCDSAYRNVPWYTVKLRPKE